MNRKQLCVLLALWLICCLALTGCGFRNKTLDGQMEQIVEVLNRDDYEGFRALLYPEFAEKPELPEIYDSLRSSWVTVDVSNVSLLKFEVTTSQGYSIYDGVYRLPRTDELNALGFRYVKSEDGEGITDLYLGHLGRNGSDASSTLLSRGSQVLSLVCSILTIVDIVRKKPYLYGWYIVLALFSFYLNAFGLSITIPLGAIIYWCVRRKVLWKSAVRTKTPVSYKPFEENPRPEQWQDPPSGAPQEPGEQ